MANMNSGTHTGAAGTGITPERWWTLAARGVLNERGRPFNPKSVAAMLAATHG